jgi:hypothetical protein
MRIGLGEGAAELAYPRFGATARLALLPGASGAPFALSVRDLRVAGLPIPSGLVDWVARNFDPTLRLRDLPVEVTVAPIRIRPGRIEIGGEAP